VGEWDGAWSDGSKEWTPYWMKKLGHTFDNDGVFWMTYQDMMITFTNLYRTRLFDSSWTVVQEWTSVNVAWLTGYLQRKFVVEIKTAGVAVFVLSQVRAPCPFFEFSCDADPILLARWQVLYRPEGTVLVPPALHPPEGGFRTGGVHLPRATALRDLLTP